MRIKVLQILLRDGIGGMETAASVLSGGLAARGHDIATIFLDGRAKANDGKRSRWRRIARIRDAVTAQAPDVVLAHSALPVLYARLAVPTRLPLIDIVHSDARDICSSPLLYYERLTRHRSAAQVFVSREARHFYEDRFGQGRHDTIPNGIALSLAGKADYLPVHENRFVSLGRLHPDKRFEDGIRSLALVPGATLDIGGHGSDAYERYLREVATDWGVSDRVSFVGPVSDVATFLSSAVALIHPSIRESQGLAVAEANALGVPAIVTEQVAPKIWWSGVCFAFPSQDVEELSVIMRGIDDSNRAEAELLAVHARRELHPDRMLTRYEDLIREVLVDAHG